MGGQWGYQSCMGLHWAGVYTCLLFSCRFQLQTASSITCFASSKQASLLDNAGSKLTYDKTKQKRPSKLHNYKVLFDTCVVYHESIDMIYKYVYSIYTVHPNNQICTTTNVLVDIIELRHQAWQLSQRQRRPRPA